MSKSKEKKRCEGSAEGSYLPASFIDGGAVTAGRVRTSRMGKRRAWVLIAIHVAIFAHLLHWQLAGRTLSPLEPSESMYSLRDGVINAGAILMALSTLSVLFVGRYFCGWACHLVALQDLCAWLLKKIGIRPRPLRSRFLWLIPLGAALVMFGMPVVYRLKNDLGPPELRSGLMKTEFWETFPGFWVGFTTFLVSGFAMIWLLGSKGFCTYACPYGGVFGVVDKLSVGRIRVSDACRACGHCTAVCTSNVAVADEVHRFGMVVDAGCMKCMDCVSVCPEGALSFGLGRPALGAKSRSKAKKSRRQDFGLGIDLAMVAVFVLTLAVFAGLPDTFAPWASSLHGQTPLLLALALAAMTAFAAGCVLRALRGESFAITGLRLRSKDGLTRGGRLFILLSLCWFAFCAHAAVVQYHWFRGKAAALAIDERLVSAEADSEATRREIDSLARTVREHIEAARRWSLLSDPRLPAEMGELAALERDFTTAAREFETAVALAPDHANWRLKLGLSLSALGRHGEAARQGRAVIELLPEDLAAHRMALRWAIFAGDWALADTIATRSIDLVHEEHRLGLRLDRIGFRLEAGDLEGARRLADELVASGVVDPRLDRYLEMLTGR